jgi:carbonic anhydrase
MKKLFDGIINFQKNEFLKYKDHFTSLERKQEPHTLFIGCSDSRIDPALITNSIPGELFIVRNIANLVPHYRETAEYVATTSAIEYALTVLKVDNIVVCGHSNCGGCNALWNEDLLRSSPHTKKWLELAQPVKLNIEKHYNLKSIDLREREWLTEQVNIVEQMNHLLTYPEVEKRCKNKSLKILGWYYIIETGDIFNYNSENSTFELIQNKRE